MKIEIGEKYNVKYMLSSEIFTAKIMSARKLGIFGYYRYCQRSSTCSWDIRRSITLYGVIRERNILYKF